MAASAKTARDTYGAIQYVLTQLQHAGDRHALFLYPAAANAYLKGSRPRSAPQVSTLAGRIGEVTLPPLERSPKDPDAIRYTSIVLRGIKAIETHDHPCGWIVDLDGDTGGNAYSMLASVAPLLGYGRLVGLEGRARLAYWITYRRDVVVGGRTSVVEPVAISPVNPRPPVAILTSQETLSAGEWVAVAFKGRSHTESFGEPTGGFTTVPMSFRLSDGAELVFGIYYLVDRSGRIYRHGLQPTVSTYLDQRAASRWLLSTTACHTK